MMRSDLGTYTGAKVPDVIRNLTIAYEPINIFRLLGFKDENVTAEEFKARVQERLKLLTVKKGGDLESDKTAVKNWLDNTVTDKTKPTSDELQSFLSSSGLTIDQVRAAIKALKSTGVTVNLPNIPNTSQLSEECKKVQKWLYTVKDVSAITPEELKTLGMTKTGVDICMPKIDPRLKYGFAKEEESVKNTSTCKKLLEEALSLVDYRGKEKFDAYVKLLKQRMSKETLMPKNALSESEFLSTCPEIEKKSIASFGFPPEVMGYIIIRENVDPFKFAGVKDTDDKSTIETRISALRDLLKDIKKKEKKQTKNFKATCSKGLDEFQSILDKGLLDNLKKYISSKSSETKLYPEDFLDDDEFKSYCMDDNPEAEPEPEPEIQSGTPQKEYIEKETIVCLFKKGDKVKRLGVGYGKIGIVIDVIYKVEPIKYVKGNIRYTGSVCRSLSVKYEDNSVETDSPTFFKLLSRESCPFKVGDFIRNIKTDNVGSVIELNFKNENGEEQDQCVSVKVNYDGGTQEDTDVGDLRKINWSVFFKKIKEKGRKGIKTTTQGFIYLYNKLKKLIEGNPPIYGPEGPPNSKCFSVVKNWLDTVADKKNITVEELKTVFNSITDEELLECLSYFDPNYTEFGFAQSIPNPQRRTPPPSNATRPGSATECETNHPQLYDMLKTDTFEGVSILDDILKRNVNDQTRMQFLTDIGFEQNQPNSENKIDGKRILLYIRSCHPDKNNTPEMTKITQILNELNSIGKPINTDGGRRKTYRKRKVQKKRSKLTRKKHNG